MIIHILIPNFWIVVEERRCPELRDRPVIVGDILAKTGGHARVLMANDMAEGFGVRSGISLSQARHLCPEAVFLSPELPLYAEVWNEIMALLLTFTPLVEALGPGEAACDVSGCERLFGDPVSVAREIVNQIRGTAELPIRAGVSSNRLVAQLAAGGSPRQSRGHRPQTIFVEPGQEAAFLSSFPVAVLPEIDQETLLVFQVLGIKTVEHLAKIPAKALTARFGSLGGRLARYARGQDDRPVRPSVRLPSVAVSRRCDDELIEHLDTLEALPQLVDLLAADLAGALQQQRLAGRLLRLMMRAPRQASRAVKQRQLSNETVAQRPQLTAIPGGAEHTPPPLSKTEASEIPSSEQFFPNQDSRIHSMLPQPKQPGRTRRLDTKRTTEALPSNESQAENAPDPMAVTQAMVRIATSRPVDDRRTIAELAQRLLLRLLAQDPNGPKPLSDGSSPAWPAQPGAELQLEMSQFAPPEQQTLSGLDGRPLDARVAKLQRQERILTSRFGATPFRHIESLNLDSILSEKIFRWGDGISK